MNSYNRPAFLHGVLDYLESQNVTLTELTTFILVSKQLNDPSRAVYRDLLHNTKPILSAFYYHPATGPSCQDWAHDAMRTRYAEAVHSLSRHNPEWHFIASQARPEQIRDFRIEDMASEMEKHAPALWSLVQSLLGGVAAGDRPARRAEPAECAGERMDVDTEQAPDGSSQRSGAEEADSEDEYWEEDDEDCEDERESGHKAALNTVSKLAGHSGGTVKRRKGRRVPQYKIDRIVRTSEIDR